MMKPLFPFLSVREVAVACDLSDANIYKHIELGHIEVIKRENFKNIMIPVVTVIGLEFGSTIAFSVVTESIFAWPGMGKLIIDSINMLDRPMIVAYLILIVALFVTINLVVDFLYTVLDPRVRLESEG